jgi:hypothetical protein
MSELPSQLIMRGGAEHMTASAEVRQSIGAAFFFVSSKA